jgi:hypothetical protein
MASLARVTPRICLICSERVHPIYFSLHMGYHFKPMNRKLALSLLICFSLSILGLAFHYHEDGVPHPNCSICSLVSHHSNVAFQDTPQISAPPYHILHISLGNTINISYLHYRCYSNRAPPA